MAEIVKYSTRLQLKYDTWGNWSDVGATFVPLKGEVCVCEIPEDIAATGEVLNEKAYLMKVGDGVTTFSSLPWISAKAADVHEWAKLSWTAFVAKLKTDGKFLTDSDLSGLSDRLLELEGRFYDGVISIPDPVDPTKQVTPDKGIAKKAWADKDGNEITSTYATKATVTELDRDLGDLKDDIGKLSNVMNFVGVVSAVPEKELLEEGKNPTYEVGDVIVHENAEYVCTLVTKDGKDYHDFVELGDVSALSSEVSAIRSWETIKVDDVSIEADQVNDTLTFTSGTAITLTGDADADKITIAHSDVNRDDTPASTEAKLAHGGEFTVITGVTSNAQGHITGTTEQKFKLPSISEIEGSISTLNNTTWRTSNIKLASNLEEGKSLNDLDKSDLMIANKEIAYLIFDCGSATVNV